jgi:hypothetical protein
MEEAQGSSVLCCPSGTAMGWPSRAGQRAGQSPLRERASPPPGYPGARPAAPDLGPAGPARPRRSATRAPWARAGLFKSSGSRGLRQLSDTAAGRSRSAARRATSPLRRAECAAPRAAALPPAWSRGGPWAWRGTAS